MTYSFSDKYNVANVANTMKAVVTLGNGGYDQLLYTAVPRPEIGDNEVLIQVTAAGVNNTEINTRLGWYSSSVSESTDRFSGEQEQSVERKDDGGWNEVTPFPFIQGTDCCGIVMEVKQDSNRHLLGKRVLVRACMRKYGFDSMENIWMASDFDGAFAQYVKVPATEVFPVDCTWSDAELGTIPCAYGTAENMVARAGVRSSSCVLITGASGGVGSAAVQLAKRRGARVVGIAGSAKADRVRSIGADLVISRDADIQSALSGEIINVIIDNVAGAGFPDLLKIISRGGTYVSSGAIAGPMVSLDMRDFYLKDISMIGCTAWDESVFPSIIGYIERGEIKPLLAATYPLENIAEAQQAFLKKEHVGNFVLIPPKD
jgi:NADPH:quinone reductase-like Zn-dependent oxidoreductase